MSEEKFSTIIFKSNIHQVQKRSILEDYKFLSYVRDPFALEHLEKCIKRLSTEYKFSDIQQKEYDNASTHCSYAYKDDYPWGTVFNSDVEKVVCRCLKQDCINFRECRKDFSLDELLILQENQSVESRIDFKHENVIIKSESDNAIAALYNDRNVSIKADKIENEEENKKSEKIETITRHETKNKEEINIQPIVVKKQDEEKYIKSDEKELLEKKSFLSFKMVLQEEYIKKDSAERTVINSGPGTGKTWALIEKIITMVETQEVEADTILILCFSRASVEVIDKRLKVAASKGRIGLEWHNIEIRTFDSFATYMISWIKDNYEDFLPKEYKLNYEGYEERIKTAAKILSKKTNMLEQYQHIIIDEVQDLVGCRAEFVLQILNILPCECGFTLLGDACQAIYDYQAQNDVSVMSSEKFYENIFSKFPKADYLEFGENHRQTESLASFAEVYRKSILTGESEKQREALKKIKSMIETEDNIIIKHPDEKEINKLKNSGTLGILTRTNGQALKISTWLRNEGIKHSFQKASSSVFFAGWLGKIFTGYEYETINADSFTETFEKVYPKVTEDLIERYWKALISTQSKEKSRYTVSELLCGVMQNARDKYLFSKSDIESDIIVSNIHRAKGKEFDSVLILDEILGVMEDDNNKDMLEHKVCYVGLTRSKKQLKRLNLPAQYIHMNRKGQNRCYQTGRIRPGKRPPLSHVEIGLVGDIDPVSFAESTERQYIIQNKLETGYALKMKLIKDENGQPQYYNFVNEDSENIVFASTSESFKKELSDIIREIYALSANKELFNYMYPNVFLDIYVDDIVTFISTDTENKSGAKVFDNVCIWNGFSVIGFAQKENDRY